MSVLAVRGKFVTAKLILESTLATLISLFTKCEKEIQDEQILDVLFDSNESPDVTGEVRLDSFDIRLLLGWYSALKAKTKLIIMIPDFEGFHPTILQDLIAILANYHSTDGQDGKIPFCFLFGLATSTETVHQALPRSCMSFLNIEKFNLQQAKLCFGSLIDKLIMNGSIKLKLGSEVYKHMLDHFQLWTLSVRSMLKYLHYAYMAHFYADPLSVFSCKEFTDNEWNQVLKCLTDDAYDLIRCIPSWQKYVFNLIPYK